MSAVTGAARRAWAPITSTNPDPAAPSAPQPRPEAALPSLPPASPAPGADLAVFRAMVDGTVPVREGLLRIAQGGGWPIRTAHGFIVAAEAPAEGTLRVAGDHNGWKAAPMRRSGQLLWSHVALPSAPNPTPAHLPTTAFIPRAASTSQAAPMSQAARSSQAAPSSQIAPRYKLVDDAGNQRPDPWARRYTYDQSGEVSLFTSPGRHLERWPQEGGPGVEPRTVRVWVPANRPVRHLYAHDGQNLFNPGAPWGGWRLQEAAGDDTLIIGIDHGADRVAELTPFADQALGATRGGKGDAYADFVQHHLRPRMEARYGKPRKVGVMGSSLGGLMALHQSERHRGAYDMVIALSPTVDWGSFGEGPGAYRERYVERMEPHRSPVLYLDSGGGPGGGDNYDGTRQLADALAERGWRWQHNLWHWHEKDAPHRESAWAARVWRPLRLFESLA